MADYLKMRALRLSQSVLKIIAKSAILFLPTIFLIIFIEIYLRIAKPDFLKTNISIVGDFTDYTSKGYLDSGVFDKKKGVFRILGLGDSFNLCLIEEDKNYPSLLQNMLEAKHGKGNIEVINAGMECVGPGYYLHILKKCGDSLRPDLVLIGFFMGNDFDETGK